MVRSQDQSTPALTRRSSVTSAGACEEAVAPEWAQGGDTLTRATRVTADDTRNSFRLGERGPTLLDDIVREKTNHFDRHNRTISAWGQGGGVFEVDVPTNVQRGLTLVKPDQMFAQADIESLGWRRQWERTPGSPT